VAQGIVEAPVGGEVGVANSVLAAAAVRFAESLLDRLQGSYVAQSGNGREEEEEYEEVARYLCMNASNQVQNMSPETLANVLSGGKPASLIVAEVDRLLEWLSWAVPPSDKESYDRLLLCKVKRKRYS
jgi:hypothetical protein